jgi:hypothetical protein
MTLRPGLTEHQDKSYGRFESFPESLVDGMSRLAKRLCRINLQVINARYVLAKIRSGRVLVGFGPDSLCSTSLFDPQHPHHNASAR